MPRKGSDYERQFCKELSLWWTLGKRDDVFWRTDGSGGRATNRGKSGKRTHGQYGDVRASDPCGAPLLAFCTFELKRGYNRYTLHDLLDRKNTAAFQKWEEWITKAKVAAKLHPSMTWAVIARRDTRDALLVSPARVMRVSLGLTASDVLGSLRIPVRYGEAARGGLYDDEWVYVMRVADFFATVTPTDVRRAL